MKRSRRSSPAPGAVSAHARLVTAGRALPTSETDAPLLHEAVVLSKQKVLLHLRQRIERDTDDDEQRGTAEGEGHVDRLADRDRQQSDDRQEDGPRQRDLRYDVVDVLG